MTQRTWRFELSLLSKNHYSSDIPPLLESWIIRIYFLVLKSKCYLWTMKAILFRIWSEEWSKTGRLLKKLNKENSYLIRSFDLSPPSWAIPATKLWTLETVSSPGQAFINWVLWVIRNLPDTFVLWVVLQSNWKLLYKGDFSYISI